MKVGLVVGIALLVPKPAGTLAVRPGASRSWSCLGFELVDDSLDGVVRFYCIGIPVPAS